MQSACNQHAFRCHLCRSGRREKVVRLVVPADEHHAQLAISMHSDVICAALDVPADEHHAQLAIFEGLGLHSHVAL